MRPLICVGGASRRGRDRTKRRKKTIVSEQITPDRLTINPQRDAFFFDFDGTLVDLAPRPDQVVLRPVQARNLAAIVAMTGGALAVLSGRNRADVASFIGDAMPIAGLHGSDFPPPVGGAPNDDASDGARRVARLVPLRRRLAGLVAGHPGTMLEDKGQALALHWRQAPHAEAAMMAAAEAALAELGADWLLQPGKCVIEIRPMGENKGDALARFMRWPAFAGRRPLAFGDDLTDIPMMAAARAAGGLAIAIGERDIPADLRLPDPATLAQWLATELDLI